MKHLIVAIYILICTNLSLQAQNIQWQKVFGGSVEDQATCIRNTSDGGYIICGESKSNISGNKNENTWGDYDYWIIKCDSLGNLIWQNDIGSIDKDIAHIIEQTQDGGYIVAGKSYGEASGDKTQNSNGFIDWWIIKLDQNGVIEWQKNHGSIQNIGLEWPSAVIQTSDGGFLVGGSYGGSSLHFLKLSAAGDSVWTHGFYVGTNAALESMKDTDDGGYIIGVTYMGSLSQMAIRIYKLDSVANQQWQKTYTIPSSNDHITEVLQTQDGGYVIGGYSDFLDTIDYVCSYFLIQTDSAGTLQWQKHFGSPGDDVLASLRILPNGDYLLAGYSNGMAAWDKTIDAYVNQGYPSYDYWVLRVNQSGDIIWQQVIGGTSTDYLYDMILGSDNSYILAGESYSGISGNKTESNFGYSDFWIVKLSFDSVSCTNCSVPQLLTTNSLTSNSTNVFWNTANCCTTYRIRLKNMSTGQTSLYIVNAPDTTKLLSGLSPNTLYKVQVRSQCSANGSILSPWSSPVYFTTLSSTATTCVPPTNPSATATSNSTAAINWTTISGANGYQLRYRINGTTTWTPTVINNGLATNTNLTGLQPNTTYQYQLRTKCSVSPLTWSNYSAIQTFSTLLRLGENETRINVDVYPNPSSGVFTLSLHATQRSNATIDIMSIDGKLIQSQNALVEAGLNNFQLDGSRWSAGVYLLKISSGDDVIYRKVVMH